MRLHLLSTSLRLTLITALLAPTTAVLAYDRVTGHDFASRSEVIAPHAMAATSQPLATQIALDIMKQGGNAIDAAIAANAALGLMEPTGNGIGGDLYAIVWSAKEQKLYGLNGSGRSPKGMTLAQMQAAVKKLGRTDIPPYGMLPISVPGAVDAQKGVGGERRFFRETVTHLAARRQSEADQQPSADRSNTVHRCLHCGHLAP